MTDVINGIIQSVANGINVVIGFLSLSPFRLIKESIKANLSDYSLFLTFLNWIVPIAEIVAVLELWGAAIAIWYGLSILMRFYKVVE